MTYELRPGIVFTRICGEYMLIPSRQASDACPSLKRLGLIGAALIETIMKKEPLEKVCKAYEILGNKSPEEAREKVLKMIDGLIRQGFLIECSENGCPQENPPAEEVSNDKD